MAETADSHKRLADLADENHYWRNLYTPIRTELQYLIRQGNGATAEELLDLLRMLERGMPP